MSFQLVLNVRRKKQLCGIKQEDIIDVKGMPQMIEDVVEKAVMESK